MSKEAIAIKALEVLARLGNGDKYGNSTGNTIARTALAEMSRLAEQPEQEPVAEVKLKTTGGNVGIATVIHEIYSHYREPLRPGDKLYNTPPAAQQEPVAWVNRGENRITRVAGWDGYGALYDTPPAAPVAWEWDQAPLKTSWGHKIVVADLAIDKDNTVSVYCERDQTAKVEAMFTPPAAQRRDIDAMIALARAAERNKVAAWMMAQGYATGHGETMEGLLEELEREVGFKRAELWIKRISEAVLAEREALAKFFEDHWRERWTDEQIVDEIRAWGDRL